MYIGSILQYASEIWGLHHGDCLEKVQLDFCKRLEKYLFISNHRYRNALCKFRVSAHNLEIETGRYFRIAPQERICKCCTSNSIES